MNQSAVGKSTLVSVGGMAVLLGIALLNPSGSSPLWRIFGVALAVAGVLTVVIGVSQRRRESKNSGAALKIPTTEAIELSADRESDCATVGLPGAIARSPMQGMLSTHPMDESQSAQDIAGRFLHWLEEDAGQDYWPGLDRWVRDCLHGMQMRHIRCFRVANGKELISLSGNGEMSESASPLVKHVLTTGRSYVDGIDRGEMVKVLAEQATEKPPAWLFPVMQAHRCIGLIRCGELPAPLRSDHAALEKIGHWLRLCWLHVQQCDALTAANRTDRVSGTLNRIDFGAVAEQVLLAAMSEGEPVVVLTLALEGVRRLDDQGQWELRDWLTRVIGDTLLQKLRSDDVAGRLSDDRFTVLLRRLDVSLAQLIACKLLASLDSELAGRPELAGVITLRCGITDVPLPIMPQSSRLADHRSPRQLPNVATLLDAALTRTSEAIRQARQADESLVVLSSHNSRPAVLEAVR